MVVDGYWYTRENFNWKASPHTAFVAYSSMLWKTERHTPDRDTDEAHDSDTLWVKYANGKKIKYTLHPPNQGIAYKNFGLNATEWILANEDRDPNHYADFESALGNTNYQWRASYKVEILTSSVATAVSIYEQATGVEYEDNIVAASVLREDIKKAGHPKDYVRFKYRTKAFF